MGGDLYALPPLIKRRAIHLHHKSEWSDKKEGTTKLLDAFEFDSTEEGSSVWVDVCEGYYNLFCIHWGINELDINFPTLKMEGHQVELRNHVQAYLRISPNINYGSAKRVEDIYNKRDFENHLRSGFFDSIVVRSWLPGQSYFIGYLATDDSATKMILNKDRFIPTECTLEEDTEILGFPGIYARDSRCNNEDNNLIKNKKEKSNDKLFKENSGEKQERNKVTGAGMVGRRYISSTGCRHKGNIAVYREARARIGRA